MPLTRDKKAVIVDEIAETLDGASIIYLTNFTGLTVGQSNELRGRLRAADVDYRVCKNTLMQLALDRIGGLEELEAFLHGPTAVAVSDDPSKPARVIKDFLEENDLDRPELKAAYIEGEIYEGPDALDVLAKLKSREELVGDVIGLLMGPIQNIAGGLQGAGGTLAGIVQTLADRDEA